MKRYRISMLLALLTAISWDLSSQILNKMTADSIFEHFGDSRNGDSRAQLKVLDELEKYLKSTDDACRLATVYGWKVDCYESLGKLDSSIAMGHLALQCFRPSCDSLTLMLINVNLTSTYLSLGENDRVIEMADRNLALWNENWPNTKSKNSFYTNKAIAQVYKGEFEVAMNTFKVIRSNAQKEGNLEAEMAAYNNISALFGVYHERNRTEKAYLDSAEYYLQKAYSIGKKLSRTEDTIIQLMNLASIASDKANYPLSLSYIDSATMYAKQGDYLEWRTTIALTQTNAYEGIGDLKNALTALRNHVTLKDSLLNSEKVKAITEMQEKYESEKKERQIKELEIDNLNATLREEQLTRTRNVYLFSGLGILLLAGGLWSRLIYTRKAKASIQKEKDISEGLLLNILPAEVANELKEKGEAEAKLVEQVTVLFTDFKGFTAMSEQLSPKDLVNDLNICFSEFDRIMAEHNIEKIKTIGDAYMAAGGLPVPNDTHSSDVVQAAFKMRDFVEAGKARKMKAGLPFFEIRIGIHTGPVVAGIVGVKKFAYDIWGDTVNTASRMESSGEVGKVNISQATYELLKDDPQFRFESRGKIKAKGKGEIEMYFVSQA